MRDGSGVGMMVAENSNEIAITLIFTTSTCNDRVCLYKVMGWLQSIMIIKFRLKQEAFSLEIGGFQETHSVSLLGLLAKIKV